jgi:hypothetical protein
MPWSIIILYFNTNKHMLSFQTYKKKVNCFFTANSLLSYVLRVVLHGHLPYWIQDCNTIAAISISWHNRIAIQSLLSAFHDIHLRKGRYFGNRDVPTSRTSSKYFCQYERLSENYISSESCTHSLCISLHTRRTSSIVFVFPIRITGFVDFVYRPKLYVIRKQHFGNWI